MPRRKCFLSYHRDDADAVATFVSTFDDAADAFIMRGIRAPQDLIDSDDADYVMSEIRRRFLADSSVTVVLIGRCTWARRFVDWEVQASLRQPAGGLPNGLLAILLDRAATEGVLPERVRLNVETGYGRFLPFPPSAAVLQTWIDDAYDARTTRAAQIRNPRERARSNKSCL